MTCPTDETARVATMFKALGDPTRLRIFEFLRTCCGPVEVGGGGEVMAVEGPTAGEVCCNITGSGKVTSTLSFHIKELRLAGLITVERRGKNMVCNVNREAIEVLTGCLAGNRPACCKEE